MRRVPLHSVHPPQIFRTKDILRLVRNLAQAHSTHPPKLSNSHSMDISFVKSLHRQRQRRRRAEQAAQLAHLPVHRPLRFAD